MPNIFSSLAKSIRSTPFFGRTIVVLSFFCLFIKQIFIFLAYGELFHELTWGATILHYVGYFVSDFLVCLILLGLVGINMLVKKIRIKIIHIIIISGIFLLFILDIFTIYFFQSRISILDIHQFINPSLGNFSGMIFSILFLVGAVGIITFFIVQSKKFKKNQRLLLAVSCLVFAVAALDIGIFVPGGFRSLPDNIFSINYSAIKENIMKPSNMNPNDTYQKFFTKKKGSDKKVNVIVVFAESLSPIDSLRIGGVHNNLPYFDLIQKQGITFTNFINNGEISADAHIGLLLGVEPIKAKDSEESSYFGYKAYTDPLPIFFANAGYTPIFVSAVDIGFLNQKTFLSGAGFSEIIGQEGFTGKKTYVFDAAPDYDLYHKTLETIKQQSGAYLMVLQTISLHKPYYTPYGSTQKDALRYADKSLFYFYLQLKKSGFFNNGILVIVSDHRKMESLEDQEKKALGDFRYARGLATLVGTGIVPGTVNANIIQQTDIFYGLKQLVGRGMITVSKFVNDIFSASKKRNRGIEYSRYSSNRKFTIISGTTGKTFNNLSEISAGYAFIHQYIGSYLAFQQGTGTLSSGKNDMIIIAHQGSWSYTGHVQGNSLAAFLAAKENGADGIEFDVSQTKDKQNVVVHGPIMYETVCNKKDVSKYTLEYIKKNCPIKNGEQIMTLEEMLKAVDGLFPYYFVEIKVYTPQDAEQQTDDAIQTVQKLGMQDKVIFTSYDKTATYFLGSYKNIHAGWDTYHLEELTILPNMNHQYYLMPYDLIKENTAQEVADIGKKMVVYTVDTTGELEKLYREGVRMIMTNDVPLMKGWADNLGK